MIVRGYNIILRTFIIGNVFLQSSYVFLWKVFVEKYVEVVFREVIIIAQVLRSSD